MGGSVGLPDAQRIVHNERLGRMSKMMYVRREMIDGRTDEECTRM